ncbi:MAG: N-acetylmannosamine-6-phosphate 2-epimerase [Chloroflexota bacterium]
MHLSHFIQQIQGGLIVSCQALPDEPLFGADIMARMAIAAQQGGARAIRANTPVDIAAICATVDLPMIGLYKEDLPNYPVYITPTLAHAKAVAKAGAHVVAIDATDQARPEPLADLIAGIHHEMGCLVLADIATLEEGITAVTLGADMVSTTMSGYTKNSSQQSGPDLNLVQALVAQVDVPVLAEGRYHTTEQVRHALEVGAAAVVVGGAITRPQQITQRFVDAIGGQR